VNVSHIRELKVNTVCISCDANLASCRYGLDSSSYSPTQPTQSSFTLRLLHRELLECYGSLVTLRSQVEQAHGLQRVTDHAALPPLLHKALVLHIGSNYHLPKLRSPMLFSASLTLFLLPLLAVPAALANNFNPHGLCKFGQPCWPSTREWTAFNRTLCGQLVKARPSAAPCHGADVNETTHTIMRISFGHCVGEVQGLEYALLFLWYRLPYIDFTLR